MFSRPVSHKREQLDRDLTFRRPRRNCYACYDSGVVTNGDGLVNTLLPDYDLLSNGCRLAGSDLPLICHCPAAYNPDGSGLRGPNGILAQGLAAELSRDQVSALHQRRLPSWLETESQMGQARQARASGDTRAMPWFVAEVRHAVAAQQALHNSPPNGPELTSCQGTDTTRRLQPLGAVMAQTLGAQQDGVIQIKSAADSPPPSAQPEQQPELQVSAEP
jgi:hypothetical protein